MRETDTAPGKDFVGASQGLEVFNAGWRVGVFFIIRHIHLWSGFPMTRCDFLQRDPFMVNILVLGDGWKKQKTVPDMC
jgi:hypothetical protein